MFKEAIILAGGLGTRLRSVVADIPKCMAPVAGKPFLHYVIAHLQKQGVDKFIFSLGYKSELIIDFIEKPDKGLVVEIGSFAGTFFKKLTRDATKLFSPAE